MRVQFTSDDVVGCVELGLGRLLKDGPLDGYEPVNRPPVQTVGSPLWRRLMGPPPKAELLLSAAVQPSRLLEKHLAEAPHEVVVANHRTRSL